MNITNNHKALGLLAYIIAIFALQQVIIIPVVSLLLILAIYRAKQPLIRSHAKYMLSIYACVIAVVLATSSLFDGQSSIVAAMTAVGLGFVMFLFGAIRLGFARKPLSNA